MGKNLEVNLNKPTKTFECQDPKHEGNRRIDDDDLWMEWPDFILRCHACYMKAKKVDNMPEEYEDDAAQE